MTTYRVIDTNVGIVANGETKAGADCELACVDLLQAVADEGNLVLDDGDLIFTEYRRHLSLKGQPGTGDMFIKWVNDNRFNPQVCATVTLTVQGPDESDFNEFPTDPALATLDRSDRKFVAVAHTHPESPQIYVAADRGWPAHQQALAASGVCLVFVCGQPSGNLDDSAP